MRFTKLLKRFSLISAKIDNENINLDSLLDMEMYEKEIESYHNNHLMSYSDYKLLNSISMNLTLKIQKILSEKGINY